MAALLPGEVTLIPIEYAPRRDLEPGGAVRITKKNFFSSFREWNHDSSFVQSVAYMLQNCYI
jgi:hypothetical protein